MKVILLIRRAAYRNAVLWGFLSIFFISCDRYDSVSVYLESVKNALSKSSAGGSVESNEDKNQAPPTPEEEKLNRILDNPGIYAPIEDEEETPSFELNKSAQVSILCYHDFTRVRQMARDMVLHEEDLRIQMKALADAEIDVISMSDFLAWKRGEKNIPDPSVVITLDDGWRAVYDVAYPVFKEFGYPFTLYLYQNYVDIGGRSLNKKQILEMIEYGAEIGNHTITHRDLTKVGRRSPEAYEEFLRSEMGDSNTFLEEFLNVDINTFAYPYGTYSDAIVELGNELGYVAMFTVNGQKATWDTPSGEIGRFVIHGKDMGNFRIATTFRGRANSTDTVLLNPSGEGESMITTTPEPGQKIVERMPEISVDVSRLEGVVADSLNMRISGIGKVFPEYNQQDGIIRYQLRQPLRSKECLVQLQLRQNGEAKSRLIPWKFFVDREALYFKGSEEAPKATSN